MVLAFLAGCYQIEAPPWEIPLNQLNDPQVQLIKTKSKSY